MESWKRFINEQEGDESISGLRAKLYMTFSLMKDPDTRRAAQGQTDELYRNIKAKMKKYYSSKLNRQALARLRFRIPQKLLKNPRRLIKKINKIIDRAPPLQYIWEKEVPEELFRLWTSVNWRALRERGGLYDRRHKQIVVNPFVKNIGYVIKEELIHYIQDVLAKTTGFDIAAASKKVATDIGIFLPYDQATMKPMTSDYYKYLTSPREFHGQMLKLKMALAEEGDVFDKRGFIFKEKLLALLRNPWMKRKAPVLQVLDPAKIDQVAAYFSSLAQAKSPKFTQQQRTS